LAMARFGFRRVLLGVATAVGVFGVGCGGYAGYLQLSGNFHPVIEGQLYRSAQPSADRLASYIKAHGIKTVINLRGAHPNTAWYDNEVTMSQGLGVKHIDFGLSATHMVSPEKADELVRLMANAEKPILIHCQSGADRTGLAAALYSKDILGMDGDKAERQLSFYYGHVGLPIVSAAYAMDKSFEDVEARDRREAANGSAATVIR
jgi:protein tyrosine/serine phosphatase